MTESGYALLKRLEEHAHAPKFTHPGYNRITPQGMARAQAFAQQLTRGPVWKVDVPPVWLDAYLQQTVRDTPFYRRRLAMPFKELPPTTRADLAREPWAFVPDGASLEDLVVYNTSGVTGHPISILTQPDTLALYIPLIQRAAALNNVSVDFDPERVGIAYLAFQRQTYTYASISPLTNHAGLVKVNLSPAEWRDPADRAHFLNDVRAQIYTGTPVALLELAGLDIRVQPAVVISTSMALNEGLRALLAERFGCPIVDVYSLNETGPVGVTLPGRPGRHRLIQPELYVEILDTRGNECAPGVRGEVTVTGGFNPLLPLLRYRTGDFAALTYEEGQPILTDLAGRPPVEFQAADGAAINNVDVSIALRPFAIAQYQLHQKADGSLRLRRRGASVPDERLRDALLGLFGQSISLSIDDLPASEKVIQYTRDTSPSS